MKKFKQAKQLPNRSTMNELTKRSTIIDYAKASPMSRINPSPAIMQNLRRPGHRGG